MRQAEPTCDRLARLPRVEVEGRSVPIAVGFRARLLGLALLARSAAGPGLLLPRCRSVHSFGMRFAIEVVFLDAELREIERRRLEPRGFCRCRRAAAVLELVPSPDDQPPVPRAQRRKPLGK